uniref:Uncharacterized protein n=1 Tax=Ananas comosus var. bracteatus TaxID=296719 RepID=A0A6V7P9D0_ANACO|nr:unnamed protein product [Ananas comosus var. bracteatus]
MGEGGNINRPHLFDGTNYAYWKGTQEGAWGICSIATNAKTPLKNKQSANCTAYRYAGRSIGTKLQTAQTRASGWRTNALGTGTSPMLYQYHLQFRYQVNAIPVLCSSEPNPRAA